MAYFDRNKLVAAAHANPAESINHWLLSEHVGPYFAYECVQNFYETTTCIITMNDWVEEEQDLKRFLSKDSYGFDFVPSKLVRYFQFDLISHDDEGSFELEDWDHQKKFKQRARKLLALTRTGLRIFFTINFAPFHGEVRRLMGLILHLKVLVPLLYQFKEAQIGFQVVLSKKDCYTSAWDVEAVGSPRRGCDVTYL